jgi:hypothetical protein
MTTAIGMDVRVNILTDGYHFEFIAKEIVIEWDNSQNAIYELGFSNYVIPNGNYITPTIKIIGEYIGENKDAFDELINMELIDHYTLDSSDFTITITSNYSMIRDDIGEVMRIDLRRIGDSVMVYPIDTDTLVETLYIQPTGGTPEWLLKQIDLPWPFELYEFDYDFCAWCGMPIEKGKSGHTNCALEAASKMFLNDLKYNVRELKYIIKDMKPIEVSIAASSWGEWTDEDISRLSKYIIERIEVIKNEN